MDSLLAEAFAPGPAPTVLLDHLSGPVDCAFLLYHFLGAALDGAAAAGAASPPPATALIATQQAPAHHRALLRKCLGPARGDAVALVCAHEAHRRAGASPSPEALAGALLAAASGGSGAAPRLALAVEDVQGLCELAGGAAQGLAVLRHLAGAQPRALLLRAPGAACEWLLDGGCGLLVAPTLGTALEQWARTLLLGRDLPSGFSKDAHGRLELWRRPAEGAAGGEGGLAHCRAALFRVGTDGTVTDPSTSF